MLIKILQGVLDERRAKKQIIDSNEKRGMVDLLMEIEDENGQKLEDEDIIDLLLMFLLAGHESSAHAGMWAVIYLHDHPQVLQKAKVRLLPTFLLLFIIYQIDIHLFSSFFLI